MYGGTKRHAAPAAASGTTDTAVAAAAESITREGTQCLLSSESSK